ncbi:MAG: pantetheine-phosphate adenylyltransferase [Nitrosomonadales bacterium]|nr:pantetheine-phosphate adenylyltransferase [Nitrosomonadales bacterium]|tara:strand:- start:27 stop:500 length:474 start_codon:yes stop_codon:yes gene_type:complete
MKVLYPGTFDPLTLGHEDIIARASKIFDHLLVAVVTDSAKSTMFKLEDRLKFVQIITSQYSNVTFTSYEGLTVEFAKANNIDVILRGARDSTDFNYESQMAQMNNTMDDKSESIFFIASDTYKSITSSLVRQVIDFKGDYSKFISQEVANQIKRLKV